MTYPNITKKATSELLVPPGKINPEGYSKTCVAFLIKNKEINNNV